MYTGYSMFNPLEQFEVHKIQSFDLYGYDLSFTNVTMYMVLVIISVYIVFGYGMKRNVKRAFDKGQNQHQLDHTINNATTLNATVPEPSLTMITALTPTHFEAMCEIICGFVNNIAVGNLGVKQARVYLPFILSVFLFVSISNIIGMIPGGFATTSHIATTLSLSLLVFGVINVIGFLKHGMHYFTIFMPHGIPKWLAPVIIPIECISYIARPFSLAVRLFVNIMAGHTMMHVFAALCVTAGYLAALPVMINVILTGFEFVVAILQAYVFSILTCLYLRDSLNLH